VEEEDESESKRLRVTEAEPIAFSSVMLNLHETMKHLTVIANIVKTVEAQRLSADYIGGGGGGGGMEQIDMDGYDGDDRAKEMIKCFRARSKTMKNVSEKIRETVKKLRTCIQQNRTYERELVNLQKMWQIVPSKIQENEVVTSDTSLSVLTGFGENCNHALSSSKDCQEAMRVRTCVRACTFCVYHKKIISTQTLPNHYRYILNVWRITTKIHTNLVSRQYSIVYR